MITLPVWIDDWVYECCGQSRRVGETAELDLTFEGDVQAVTGPDNIEVLDDGQVVIVGSALGPVADEDNHTPGTLIVSGAVQFAIPGAAPGPRVKCSGRLSETRHGWPAGRMAGELVGICWHPAIVRSAGAGNGVIEGYGAGEEQASTDDWRERHGGTGRGSWALELIVEVSGDVAGGSRGTARGICKHT